MASLENPRSVADRAEFRAVLLDDYKPGPGEWRAAAIGTLAVHLIFILALVSVPRDLVGVAPERELPRRVTPLVDPPTRLTQKAPNKAPVSQAISVAPVAPAPKIAPVPARRFQPPPPAQVARRNPAPILPQEPPKVVAAQPQQTAQIAPPAALTPPLPRAEPPKIVLEAPPAPPPSGQGTGRLKVPGSGIQEAIRELSHSSSSPSRSVGDDIDDVVEPSLSQGRSLPTPTRPKLNLELESDPNGVDMKPYLLQVLQDVRRNWLTIYPESARIGARGRVVVQFSIAPNGAILKTVFMSHARLEALDRAAIAALTMSDPLPQLPSDYKGNRVVLQFTFAYNSSR